jgi:two-component system chemotaxis response regulator CheY
VVEPSATLRRAVKNALKAIGVDEIVEATDGSQALTLGDASIDLVITEWTVPGIGGIELIKRLKENPETSRAAVLMLTARNRKNDVLEAVHAGVNGYLLKPFTSEGLRHGIETLLAGLDDQAQAA